MMLTDIIMCNMMNSEFYNLQDDFSYRYSHKAIIMAVMLKANHEIHSSQYVYNYNNRLVQKV